MHAAQIFLRMEVLGTREQLLGNYIERVAALITDAALVPHVLRCLAGNYDVEGV
jgi:hypothetical protein